MEWITLDETRVLADFPTDLKSQYDIWLLANPSKSGRLVDVTESTVAEFRDAIASNPANHLDEDEEKIPASCLRSAEVIIYNTMANEMGLTLASDDAQAMTRAEIFLRQIGYKHFVTTGDDEEPTPYYSLTDEESERALP